MTQTADPRAEGLSANAYCGLLMKQRHSYDAQGRVLLLPRIGIVVVPFEKHPFGWKVAVVEGNAMYPRGGHHLSIGDAEIETALEVRLTEREYVHTREEADALPDGESIHTPGGIVFRKMDRWDEPGVTYWGRFQHQPIPTTSLDEDMHFPARVLGTPKGS
jgi:hypothetical protein